MAEMAKKAAEGGGGLALAVHAVALQNFRAQQDLMRRKNEDDHKLAMAQLGMEGGDMTQNPEGEAMGNIVITGDIYSEEAAKTLKMSFNKDAGKDDAAAGQKELQDKLDGFGKQLEALTQAQYAQANQPVIEPEPQPNPVNDLLKKAALGAAIGLGSLGVGAIGGYLAQPDQAPRQEFVDTDTDTIQPPSFVTIEPASAADEE